MTLEDIVRKRIGHCQSDIEYALQAFRAQNPFAAEPSEQRRQRRLQSKLNVSPVQAEVLNREVVRRAMGKKVIDRPELAPTLDDRREAIWGDTVDFVSVAFLERGAQIARSVGRVAFRNGRAQGTGVLIGQDLFLTNNHVVESQADANRFVLEFDYERDLAGRPR